MRLIVLMLAKWAACLCQVIRRKAALRRQLRAPLTLPIDEPGNTQHDIDR